MILLISRGEHFVKLWCYLQCDIAYLTASVSSTAGIRTKLNFVALTMNK